MKKFTTISILISYFSLLFIPTSLAQNFLFPDVKGSDWFYEDVLNMIKRGVMKGNSDGTFRPQNSVNRAEVSAILNRYDAKVKLDNTLELDKLRYVLIQSLEQNALLYQNIASLYNITTESEPSCDMIDYYYRMMENNYEVASNLSNIITYSDLKIDSNAYSKKLSNFKKVFSQCDFK